MRQPSAREIAFAANSLGISAQLTELASLPMVHWEKLGYVTLGRSGSKIASLKAITSEIARARQKQGQTVEPKRDKR